MKTLLLRHKFSRISLSLLTFAAMWISFLLLNPLLHAQVTYQENFEVNSGSFTGNFARFTGTSACGGSGGSMRRNLYSSSTFSTGQLISPSVGNSLGGATTVTFSYKVANWSANNVGTSGNWGNFTVQYGPTATGPWTTVFTVNSTNHIVSGTCASLTTPSFTPAPGALFIRFNATWAAGDYYLNFDNIEVTESQPPCSGIPSPGNTLSTGNNICPNTTFTLSVQNATPGSAITRQWQNSADGNSWTDISGATQTTLVVSNQTESTWYRCQVTCSGLGTGTSTPLLVSITDEFYNCYAAAAATNTSDSEIFNVSVGSSSQTSDCSTTAPGPGSINRRYSNYKSLGSFANLDQGASVPFSVTLASCGGNYTRAARAWIDFNRDGVFDNVNEVIFNSGSISSSTVNPTVNTSIIQVPSNAGLGITGMRVSYFETTSAILPTSSFAYGEVEDYLVTITMPPPCMGTPVPGNTLATESTVCANTTFNLSTSENTNFTGAGVSFQWQQSADGISWTDIPGAQSSFYNGVTQSTATYYRLQVTCATGGTGTSTPVLVGQNPPTQCYCIPTSSSGCSFGDLIARVKLNTLDNNSGTSCVSFYNDYTSNPNLTTTLQAGTAYSCEVFAGAYAQVYAAWIDYNDDGIFDISERIGFTTTAVLANSSASFPVALACNPPVGTHRLRIRSGWNVTIAGSAITPCGLPSDYGEVEDYLITIAPPPPCPVPSSLASTGATSTTASVSWLPGCIETAWQLEYGPVGFTPGTGTTLSADATSATISGLEGNTTYHVYVRADCDVNGLSQPFGPVSVKTACGIPSMIFTASVSSNSANIQWSPTVGATSYGYVFGSPGLTCSASLFTSGTSLTFNNLIPNTTYSLCINTNACGGSPSGEFASFSFTTLPPANDQCSGAIPVSCNATITGSTIGSTADNEVNGCPGSDPAAINNGVWYSLLGDGSQITLDLCGSSFDTEVHVFSGSCGNLTCVASNDDYCELASNLVFNTVPGITYYILVSGQGSNMGAFSMEISCFCGPPLTEPWAVSSIGNAVGQAVDNVCGGTIDVQSNGFSPNLSNDLMYYAYQTICGDGSITVKLNSVTNNGSGGVMWRENLTPGSKMVSLKTKLSNQITREIRVATNGSRSTQNSLNTGGWMRITRNGNLFEGFRSPNGINWIRVFGTYVTMSDCITVGIYGQGINVNATTEAKFGNIQIIGSGVDNLVAPVNIGATVIAQPDEFTVFPNPAETEINIEMNESYLGKPLTLLIKNQLGQTISTRQYSEMQNLREIISLEGLSNGVYLITLMGEDGRPNTKKFVVSQSKP